MDDGARGGGEGYGDGAASLAERVAGLEAAELAREQFCATFCGAVGTRLERIEGTVGKQNLVSAVIGAIAAGIAMAIERK